MKKIFEIIFVFILCLTSFCVGWVMSLKHQKTAFKKQASTLSQKEMASLREPPKSLALEESSLMNFPLPNIPISVSEGSSNASEGGDGETQMGPLSQDQNPSKEGESLEKQKPEQKTDPQAEESSLLKEMKKRMDKFDKLNRKAFNRIKKRQNVFNEKGQYSFLINVFSKEDEAIKYAQNLRGQFPLWNFFLRPDKQNLRVYLGPFLTKDRAGDFIKALPDPKPFPNYFLELEGF